MSKTGKQTAQQPSTMLKWPPSGTEMAPVALQVPSRLVRSVRLISAGKREEAELFPNCFSTFDGLITMFHTEQPTVPAEMRLTERTRREGPCRARQEPFQSQTGTISTWWTAAERLVFPF
ncbi:hypothetical protein L596_014466 [Steinernema carpocapsae]|uniref:Uncharacterized protein n=1 Tax=Steinernema carpocapsae TaxID=34508 RepID=A0A4V6A2T3_STECR|nr:hypothetical protein L596_014466 [Steinernema carpocapsae]